MNEIKVWAKIIKEETEKRKKTDIRPKPLETLLLLSLVIVNT